MRINGDGLGLPIAQPLACQARQGASFTVDLAASFTGLVEAEVVL